jgi:hypothetical protein
LDGERAAHIIVSCKHHGIGEVAPNGEKVALEAAVNCNGTFDIVRASLATLRTGARNPLAEAVLAIASNSSSKLLT